MSKSALKPICPCFEFKSAGDTEARIACKHTSGHIWKTWGGKKGDRAHLEQRNEYFRQYCCKNPWMCDNYKIIGP